MPSMSSRAAVLKTALWLFVAASAFAEDAETVKDALSKGEASVSLRYRFELVDEGSFEKDAYASTLRTTLGYRTLPFKGASFFIEAQNVAAIFGDGTFNNLGAGDLGNGVMDRPAVPDPSQTRMQQVYLRYDAFGTTFDLGRREIIYGDHRFVGNVMWRQNHQTFDAVHLVNDSLAKAKLSYSFVDNVIRIFGDEQDMASHFLNGVIDVTGATSLELFGYLLDYQEEPLSASSTQTYGFRLLGAEPVSQDVDLLFEAEYAKQKEFKRNPTDLDASYLELVGGVGFKGLVNLRVGRELLGAAEGLHAFQTPLATLHKFNGWADRFLKTPADGLIDRFVRLDGSLHSFSWFVSFHDFVADEGDASYGSELDASLSYRTSWAQVFATKFALYREDGFSTDASKFWVWTQYAF